MVTNLWNFNIRAAQGVYQERTLRRFRLNTINCQFQERCGVGR